MSLIKISRVVGIPTTLLLGGCGSQPDYTPFADGMRAIAISLVVFAVVQALAELVMAEDKKPKDRPPKLRRPRQNKRLKGGD